MAWTQQIDLTTSWLNLTLAAGFEAGDVWTMDIRGLSPLATVFTARTDDLVEPTVTGHPWRPTARGTAVPTRILEVGNETVWIRVDSGAATLILTPS